jgi:2-dehydro-3-deoxy-D-gluconate 5-dehydrogenase
VVAWVVLIIASEMTTDKDASDEKNQSTLELDSVPAKRAGNVIDMGRVALFLGSRGSEYVNGQIVAVDGGYLLDSPSAG